MGIEIFLDGTSDINLGRKVSISPFAVDEMLR
jgi:hypothetical protein